MIDFNRQLRSEEDGLVKTVNENSKSNSRFDRCIEFAGKSLLGAGAGAAVGLVGASAIHLTALGYGDISPENMEMLKVCYGGLAGLGALMGIPYIFMGDDRR